MSAFDPWTASWSEAQQAGREFDVADPCNPIFQLNAAQVIEAMRTAVESGDGFVVLACIRKVVAHGLIAPDWLATAYIRRYDAVLNCRAGSWDDPLAFGKPYPKGVHLSALRRRRELRFAVVNAITDIKLRDPERPIDAGLFEEVGELVGIGKTTADELYYEGRKLLQKLVTKP